MMNGAQLAVALVPARGGARPRSVVAFGLGSRGGRRSSLPLLSGDGGDGDQRRPRDEETPANRRAKARPFPAFPARFFCRPALTRACLIWSKSQCCFCLGKLLSVGCRLDGGWEAARH